MEIHEYSAADFEHVTLEGHGRALARMTNDELRRRAEDARRTMARRPAMSASGRAAARLFHQYAAELHARAQRELRGAGRREDSIAKIEHDTGACYCADGLPCSVGGG